MTFTREEFEKRTGKIAINRHSFGVLNEADSLGRLALRGGVLDISPGRWTSMFWNRIFFEAEP